MTEATVAAGLRGLPAPDPEAARHCAHLRECIREAIAAAGGSLDFERFMELALYAPGLGYYSAGSRKFGAGGDFITAPELSPLFSRCLARACRPLLAGGGGDILEFGAGSGVMAAGVLAELERCGTLPGRYYILERSADLRERQARTLAERVPEPAERVQWLEHLPAPGFRGVMLANEVLDALPVRRFRWRGGQVHEWRVAAEGEGFGWAEAPAPRALRAAVERLAAAAGLPDDYTSEICPGLAPWVRSVAEVLERGVLLLIDYGYPRGEYYHPQRDRGTLQCHYRHRVHGDPLILTGLQDITAHVDFTAVAEAGEDGGLELSGFTTQAHFLLDAGLEEFLAEGLAAGGVEGLELARQAKALTLPGEMGERFRCLALGRGIEGPLPGFRGRDLRDRL